MRTEGRRPHGDPLPPAARNRLAATRPHSNSSTTPSPPLHRCALTTFKPPRLTTRAPPYPYCYTTIIASHLHHYTLTPLHPKPFSPLLHPNPHHLAHTDCPFITTASSHYHNLIHSIIITILTCCHHLSITSSHHHHHHHHHAHHYILTITSSRHLLLDFLHALAIISRHPHCHFRTLS